MVAANQTIWCATEQAAEPLRVAWSKDPPSTPAARDMVTALGELSAVLADRLPAAVLAEERRSDKPARRLAALYALGIMWMRALARFPAPARLLASEARHTPDEIPEAVAAWRGAAP